MIRSFIIGLHIALCLALISCSNLPRFISGSIAEVPPDPAQTDSGAHTEERGENSDDWRDWSRRPTVFASVVQALVATLLLVLTIVQCGMLYRANRTASLAIKTAGEANITAIASLDEARRNRGLYMEAERGKLSVHSPSMRAENAHWIVYFTVENIGRSAVTILDDTIDAKQVELTDHIQGHNPNDVATPRFVHLAAGAKFDEAGPGDSIYGCRVVGVVRFDPKYPRIHFRGVVRYQTSFGTIYRYAFSFNSEPDIHPLEIHPTNGPGFNFDLPESPIT